MKVLSKKVLYYLWYQDFKPFAKLFPEAFLAASFAADPAFAPISFAPSKHQLSKLCFLKAG